MAETLHHFVQSSMLVRPEISSFLLGICAHLTLFRRGEWDRSFMRLCYFYLGLLLLVFLRSLLGPIQDGSLTFPLFVMFGTKALCLAVAHLLGVFGSMTTYRLFFHRLTRFPGPFWGRISGFYMLHMTRRKWQRFAETQKLHQKYGDFVRVGKKNPPLKLRHRLTLKGPQSLSITHPEATRAIYAPNTVCTRGPFYEMTLSRETIFMTRSKQFHSKHRKDWDRAFSATGEFFLDHLFVFDS